VKTKTVGGEAGGEGKISPLSFIKGRFGGFGRRRKDVFA
jgi:hypothetical protein